MKAWFLFFVGLVAAGFGSIPGENPPVQVVEAVEVCLPAGETAVFRQPEKINRLLRYLRQMDAFPAPQAEIPQTGEYTLTLRLSGGTLRTYRIREGYCLPPDARIWQTVTGWSALRLPCLLAAMPPDSLQPLHNAFQHPADAVVEH